MDWINQYFVRCPNCNQLVRPEKYYHPFGCGIYNRVKSDIPHWHFFCPRGTLCMYDWIPE